MANSVHLHGSYSNGRMMWYHDHAIDHTAENAYFGQAGAYLVHDAAEDALGLPSGYGKYDIPMILSAKARLIFQSCHTIPVTDMA
ncbi:Bilirubin oxidase like protein [Verticillium longisporum]|nr:Bilirubin oxidase like protein [Verticillium longisporum]